MWKSTKQSLVVYMYHGRPSKFVLIYVVYYGFMMDFLQCITYTHKKLLTCLQRINLINFCCSSVCLAWLLDLRYIPILLIRYRRVWKGLQVPASVNETDAAVWSYWFEVDSSLKHTENKQTVKRKILKFLYIRLTTPFCIDY